MAACPAAHSSPTALCAIVTEPTTTLCRRANELIGVSPGASWRWCQSIEYIRAADAIALREQVIGWQAPTKVAESVTAKHETAYATIWAVADTRFRVAGFVAEVLGADRQCVAIATRFATFEEARAHVLAELAYWAADGALARGEA